MTDLLDQAIESLRRIAPEQREEVARAILELVGDPLPAIVLSEEDRAAIDEAEAEFERGEVASDADVRAIWAKHGL